MPETYLTPEDVSPADARKVLDFLNTARTSAEIAAAVEIPGERDVGLRVARRILDRRRELGAFTSLQQVADVVQVGPERFTEIVTTLAATGDWEPRGMIDTASQVQLLQEVAALRQTVEALKLALGAGHRVTLRAVESRPFLGQPVTIVAEVTDALDGTPSVNVPVTFVATWGRLRTVDGGTVEQGSSVTARTGVDGTVRVTLLPPTSEDLWDLQQDALETMLRLLDPEAETPRETQAGLEEMARQYRWEANVQFRRAVDIYFRDFRHRLLDTINYRDYMAAWSAFDSTVIACARDGEQGDTLGTSVQGTAALPLRFRDWLGPWLQTYLSLSETESTLGHELDETKQRTGEPGALLDGVYRRVRDFVDSRWGLVGEYAGRRVAETSLHRFVESGIADLPLDTRIRLSPALEVASSTIATSGTGVLAALGHTRASLRQEMATRVGEVDSRVGRLETDSIGGLAARVDGLQAQLGQKLDTATFTGFQDGVATQLAGKVDTASFNRFRDQTNTALNGKLDRTAFADFQQTVGVSLQESRDGITRLEGELTTKVSTQTFEAALAQKVDTTDHSRFQDQVHASLAQKADVTALDAALTKKVDVTTLDAALSRKVDTAAFTSFQSQVNDTLQTKVDNTTFTRFSNNVNTRLGSLQGSVNNLSNRITFRPPGP